MNSEELATRVETVCARDPDAFDAWVREEAEWLREAIAAGAFDSEVRTLGMEYECYAVDGDGALQPLPPDLDALPGCETEIGRHQLELCASPQPLSGTGLETIETELRARFEAASDHLLDGDEQLASDGVWTVPPQDAGAVEYLTQRDDDAPVPLATNMVDEVRYHAQGRKAGTNLDVPHVSCDGDTALLNSLTTSIQPHYAVPEATALPEFFGYALRVAGPLLALGVNSPLFPPELYDGSDPETVLADGRLENRIGIFESVMNAENPGENPKVDFPDDIDSVDGAIESIVEDPTLLPLHDEDPDRLTHFQHKHGCYWRWVRPVFDAGGPGDANVRIEFRPLPGQPTLRDATAFLGLFAGLLTDLPRRDHPVAGLDWTTARENFYAAAADGLDADLRWLDRDGEPTTATGELFDDLFRCATEGLQRAGLDPELATRLLAPLRARAETRVTPARWKLDRTRAHLDAGHSFDEAVRETQRDYLRQQAETFAHGRFDWW